MANLREVFQPLEDYKEAVKAAATHFPGVCSLTHYNYDAVYVIHTVCMYMCMCMCMYTVEN